MRPTHRRTGRAWTIAATALVLAGAARPTDAAAEFGGTSARVREITFARRLPGASRTRTRIDLTVALPSGTPPAVLSLHAGGFAVDVTLRNGRFTGRIRQATGTVAATVTTRRYRLRATLRTRMTNGGSVIGETVARGAADAQESGAMTYDLEEATLTLDGAATPLALGLAARAVVVPRPGHEYGAPPLPKDLFRADVVGAALTSGALPVVQFVPLPPGTAWTGRIRGQVLTPVATARLASSLNGGLAARLDPLDEEAGSLGPSDAVAPGVRSIVVAGTTWFQTRFDAAVQAQPGAQSVTVTGFASDGTQGAETLDFEAPTVALPLALSADDHVLEVRRDR